MALFDKVKAQAQDVAKKAQGAASAGQAKIDELQQKRQLDQRYRDLGEAYYAEQSGSGSTAAVETALEAVRTLLAEMDTPETD